MGCINSHVVQIKKPTSLHRRGNKGHKMALSVNGAYCPKCGIHQICPSNGKVSVCTSVTCHSRLQWSSDGRIIRTESPVRLQSTQVFIDEAIDRLPAARPKKSYTALRGVVPQIPSLTVGRRPS